MGNPMLLDGQLIFNVRKSGGPENIESKKKPYGLW